MGILAKAKALERSRPKSWFDRLPANRQREALELRAAYQAGEIEASVQQLVALLATEWKTNVTRNTLAPFLMEPRDGDKPAKENKRRSRS